MGATSPYWLPLAVAVIAAAAMLGVARMANVREREARRADHESQRLADLLDAAVDLREQYQAIADSIEPTPEKITAYDRAEAMFVARAEAVRSRHVRTLAAAWASVIHAEEGPSTEPRAWTALLLALGTARRLSV